MYRSDVGLFVCVVLHGVALLYRTTPQMVKQCSSGLGMQSWLRTRANGVEYSGTREDGDKGLGGAWEIVGQHHYAPP